MQVFLKQYALAIALFVTLAMTVWTAIQEEQSDALDVVLSKPAKPRGEHVQHTLASTGNGLRREVPLHIVRDLFPGVESQPMQAVQTEVAPINVNPYTYAGKIVDGGVITVFLIEGEKNHAVKKGDVIEQLWKIKSISPPSMILKNLDTKTEVQIEIGAIS